MKNIKRLLCICLIACICFCSVGCNKVNDTNSSGLSSITKQTETSSIDSEIESTEEKPSTEESKVSAEEKTAIVPDVCGMTVTDASTALNSVGFDTTFVFYDHPEKNHVVFQQVPTSDTIQKLGSTITVSCYTRTFSYYINESGNLNLSKIERLTETYYKDKELTIPNEYNGKSVSNIVDECLSTIISLIASGQIKKLHIPQNVLFIDSNNNKLDLDSQFFNIIVRY